MQVKLEITQPLLIAIRAAFKVHNPDQELPSDWVLITSSIDMHYKEVMHTQHNKTVSTVVDESIGTVILKLGA